VLIIIIIIFLIFQKHYEISPSFQVKTTFFTLLYIYIVLHSNVKWYRYKYKYKYTFMLSYKST